MYFDEQPDSADTNHIDCVKPNIGTGENQVNSVHENSVSNSIPDTGKVTHQDDHISSLRSDSFSDEWQDFTTSASDGSQGVPQYDNSTLDSSEDNTSTVIASDISAVDNNVDFISLSKTVLRQCFNCGTHNHSISDNEDFDCQDE